MSDVKRRRLEALEKSLADTQAAPQRAHVPSGSPPVQRPSGNGAAQRPADAVGPARQLTSQKRDGSRQPKHWSPSGQPGSSQRRQQAGSGRPERGGPPAGATQELHPCYSPLPLSVARAPRRLDMRGLHYNGRGGEAGASEWVFAELGRLQLQHPTHSLLDPAQAAARLEHCIKNKVVFLQSGKDKKVARALRRGPEHRPVSAKAARQQRLYEVPTEQCQFVAFQALHQQWCKHAAAVVEQHAQAVSLPGPDGALAPAVALHEVVDHLNWHGAFVTVARCSRPALCGVEGIVIKHTAKALHVVTPANSLHVLPLKGAAFRAVVGPHTVEVEGTALPPPLGGRTQAAAAGKQKNEGRNAGQHLWFV